MWRYDAPVRRHALLIDAGARRARALGARMPAFAELDADTAAEVLAAGRRASPARCWRRPTPPATCEGCTLDARRRAPRPPGYRAAYRAFVDGGWPALACAPERGRPGPAAAAERRAVRDAGRGQPRLDHVPRPAARRLRGAARRHASAELRERYLAKLVSGEWLAHDGLTEPQAGSDLGLVRTSAPMPQRRRQPVRVTRQQDLHLRRRPRPDRQHRAPGAVPPARCAARHQGPVAGAGAQVPARRHAQRGALRRHREEDGHQGQRHLPMRFERRHRLAGRRAATAAWRRCS